MESMGPHPQVPPLWPESDFFGMIIESLRFWQLGRIQTGFTFTYSKIFFFILNCVSVYVCAHGACMYVHVPHMNAGTLKG